VWRTLEGDECSVYPVRVTSPRLPLALLLAASAFALTGCSPEAAVPSAPPSAEAEPLFASDEEALAAAEAAFERYLDVSFAVLADGGTEPERLEEVSTGEILENDLAQAEEYRERGLKQTGDPVVLETALQSYNGGDVSDAEVTVYSCLDSFSVQAVDQSGNPVGDSNRQPTVTIENVFVAGPEGELLLSESSLWEDGPACELS